MRWITVTVIFISLKEIESIKQGMILEVANFIPDINFKPSMSYEVGGQRYFPVNTENIVRANGYPFEKHLVETEDGYILEMHRIPPIASNGRRKPPVLLLHGNFQSSADWIINSPANSSLGFMLWNNGYDVWMGNHRGNTYSTQHKNFTRTSSNYWDFSFDELGLFDTPAMIDYILGETGSSKVHYITFSMGTSAFLASMSLREEYNEKISLAILMGPGAFFNHFFFGAVKLIPFAWSFGAAVYRTIGSFPILPEFAASFIRSFLPIFCNPKLDVLKICYLGLHLMFGFDGNAIAREQLPLITSVAPTTTSFKTYDHFVQLASHGGFVRYDYGKKDQNFKHYGQIKPPAYNLSAVTSPVVLMLGKNDFIASKEDAKDLAKVLPNLVDYYEVPYGKFTHIDFTYGRNVAVIAYEHALGLLEAYS